MDAFWTSPLLLIFPGRMIGESMGRHGSWIGAKRRARARATPAVPYGRLVRRRAAAFSCFSGFSFQRVGTWK